ncbi:apyrase [Planococcus citri]|uniref:apyrase n=1 Tax=Planococcus citri TaxID=170843 RepID=UPI0031F9D234
MKSRYNKKVYGCKNVFNFRMSLRDWRQALNSSPTYRMSNGTLRFQVKFVTFITILGLFVLFYAYSEYNGNMTYLKEYQQRKSSDYNYTYPLTHPKIVVNGLEYRIGIVTDLDTRSKVEKNQYSWISYYLKGNLIWDSDRKTVSVYWDKNPTTLQSSYGAGGRGMELSELVVFDGKLLTFDDRTGIVYQVIDDGVIPWVILMDGNGKSAKGFKSEWATVKNNKLHVGSMGKEWTTPKGDYVNHNPMWIKTITSDGQVKHIDWNNNYRKLRQTVDIDFPGYMIHESGVWSDIHKKWFFLPRRSSQSPYEETADEYKGTNILLIADENFDRISVKNIGILNPTRGFSTFKFLPVTNDYVIAALKSEEYNGTCATYITVFTIDGEILLPDKKIADLKYEGLEFV